MNYGQATFSGGVTIHLENLKPCVVHALFTEKEIAKLHENFITSQLSQFLKRNIVRSAKIIAPGQDMPVALSIWLLAVHESRPPDEPIDKMAVKILCGEIDARQFLILEH